jgi:catalase-peroxidase
MADMIILAGSAALEKAVQNAGYNYKVPFTPGRMDASQEQTDVESFAFLEPKADGFRNYYSGESSLSPTQMLMQVGCRLMVFSVRSITWNLKLAEISRCRSLIFLPVMDILLVEHI